MKRGPVRRNTISEAGHCAPFTEALLLSGREYRNGITIPSSMVTRDDLVFDYLFSSF